MLPCTPAVDSLAWSTPPTRHGRTCPHRPGFRLGDSRRQGYRVRVRSDCGSGLGQDYRRTAQGRRSGRNANAFKDFLAGKDIPSRTTALLNAASAIVADGNLVGNGTLAERFAEATSWPRKPSIPARPKPVRQVDRNRQVQGVIWNGFARICLPFLHYQLFRVAGVHRLQFVTYLGSAAITDEPRL